MADLFLGTDVRGELVSLTESEQIRNTLIVGPPGTGKTGLLINVVIQFIENSHGLLLIDPDGGIVDHVERYCAKHRHHRRRPIHILDPHTVGHCLGFDPLALDVEPSSAVPSDTLRNLRVQLRDDVVKMICVVFEHENPNAKPQHQRVLTLVLEALIEHELPLTDALLLTTARDNSGLRHALTRSLSDPNMQLLWEDLVRLPAARIEELFASLQNRFIQIVGRPIVARMLGQQRRTINFRRVIAEGGVILVNLRASDQFSLEASRLVGTMLISKLITSVSDRDEQFAKQYPFHLIVDEAPLYLTEDIEWLLDRLRKRGVHLIAAVQREGQLAKFSEGIRNALLEGTGTKIVFRQNSHEGAQFFGRELFAPEYDLSQVKRETPAVVGHHIEWLAGESVSEATGGSYARTNSISRSHNRVESLIDSRTYTQSENASETRGENTSEQRSRGSSSSDHGEWGPPSLLGTQQASFPKTWDTGRSDQSGTASGLSHAQTVGQASSIADTTGRSLAEGTGEGATASVALSTQWNVATTHSYHEALVPDIEWLPAEFKSYPEVEHDFAVLLRQLPDRHCVIKTLTKPAVVIKTLDNPETFTTLAKLAEFRREVVARSAYTSTDEEIADEFAQRRSRLTRLAATETTNPRPTATKLPRPETKSPPLKDEGWG